MELVLLPLNSSASLVFWLSPAIIAVQSGYDVGWKLFSVVLFSALAQLRWLRRL